ncbi:MAG: MotA/TolQ/ExbB proton channel family protein [Candidatus Omnitrophica bacterium]|nr:MotA/TolQ/ExbB proton channel family protein [Candidatus Omnitrophota bacterium]
MPVVVINAWGLLFKGGPMMWPILFLSILSITIGIEKFLFLNAVDKQIRKFKLDFLKAIRDNRIKDALSLCEEHPVGLGLICKAGVMKFGASIDLIRQAMQERAGIEIHRLKQHLGLLQFIINAAVMLGLLGTTTALCVVFHAAQMRSNALNPLSLGDMSSGIWQALVTTASGLFVGVLTFAIYSFVAMRVNDLIAVFDQSIQETITILQAVSEME